MSSAAGKQDSVPAGRTFTGDTDLLLKVRAIEAERDELASKNLILCEANEHLLLATLDAQNLRADAEKANERQNEFLAMLAHELRNPLAPIGMASKMLLKVAAPSAQLLNVQKIIERQVTHLSRLLDDLLDAARINSGKIKLLRSSIVLADQLTSAVETVQLRIAERNQTIELHVPPQNVFLFGDPVRLAQAFSNLLINASKYTHDGGKIVVSSWVENQSVVVTIADNGEGIASDVLPHIFSLFTQGPRALARSEGGLGVGLNVVRNVIELHDGTVEATSSGLGQGALFTVKLPLPVFAECPMGLDHSEVISPHRHRVLVVEDNHDALEMLAMFLRSEGYTVVTASDGVQGIEIASAQKFDVVVCDIGLPGMDGYDFIRYLHKQFGSSAPYSIAASGYGRSEDRALAKAAGFDQYLVKPVDVDALLELMRSVPVGNVRRSVGPEDLDSKGDLCD